MKLCIISDTHTKHKMLQHLGGIPECDILVHCGDFTWVGKYWEVRNFMRWFLEQPARHKVLICGNHEETFDHNHKNYNPTCRAIVTQCAYENFHYLENSSVTIEGLKFYGTPWTPFFYDWAFNGITDANLPFHPRGVSLTEIYNKIPEDVQILISHGPPYDILDMSERGDERTGSVEMRKLTSEKLVQLRLFLCGHIHEARGEMVADGNVQFVNASTLDRSYSVVRPPILIDLDENGFTRSIVGLGEEDVSWKIP